MRNINTVAFNNLLVEIGCREIKVHEFFDGEFVAIIPGFKNEAGDIIEIRSTPESKEFNLCPCVLYMDIFDVPVKGAKRVNFSELLDLLKSSVK